MGGGSKLEPPPTPLAKTGNTLMSGAKPKDHEASAQDDRRLIFHVFPVPGHAKAWDRRIRHPATPG